MGSRDVAGRPDAERAMNRNVESLRGANEYYRWNLGVFPFEKGMRIVDVGCGPGLYFCELMDYAPARYLATDSSLEHLDQIRSLFDRPDVCGTCRLDLEADSLPGAVIGEKFDCVLCFDVLEHIHDDEKAARNLRDLMAGTGAKRLFLRVPALPFIYGRNDGAIGHFRRYSAKALRSLLVKSGFRVHRMRYQNVLGIIPWFWVGRVVKRPLAISGGEAKAFNLLVPLLRFVERAAPPLFGLSLYCVCSIDPPRSGERTE